MDKAYRRQVKLAFFIVFLLFLFVAIFSFFYYRHKSLTDYSDLLDVSFQTSDVVVLKNTIPISDTLGRNIDGEHIDKGVQGYVDFTIKNKSNELISYDIILTKQVVEGEEIKDSFVKFYLTDYEDIPFSGFNGNYVPSFADLNYLSDKPSSKLLLSDQINKNEEKKYRLRVWLSDRYSISFTEESFSVDVDVRVK